jgi:transposase
MHLVIATGGFTFRASAIPMHHGKVKHLVPIPVGRILRPDG